MAKKKKKKKNNADTAFDNIVLLSNRIVVTKRYSIVENIKS